MMSAAARMPAARSFDARRLPGLAAWYDVSRQESLYQSRTGPTGPNSVVDGVVGCVSDLSGLGRHLITTTDARRPALRQAGSLYRLEFDDVDDGLRATFTLEHPFTRVMAFRVIAFATGDYIFDGGRTDASFVAGLNMANALGSIRQTVSGVFSSSNATIVANTDYVSTEVFNSSSSRFAINNGSNINGNFAATSAGGLAVGARAALTGSFARIHFYGGIICTGVLSDADIAVARRGVGALAGLTL